MGVNGVRGDDVDVDVVVPEECPVMFPVLVLVLVELSAGDTRNEVGDSWVLSGELSPCGMPVWLTFP